MLSFRFDLTAAQLNMLMLIYAGSAHPSSIVTEDNIVTGTPYAHSHFIPVVMKLIDKGLVVHVDRRAKTGEKGPFNDGTTKGYVCTERGRMIAQVAVESAQRIIGLAGIATSRGLDTSSREEGVA